VAGERLLSSSAARLIELFATKFCPTLKGVAVSNRHTPIRLKAFLPSMGGQGVGFVYDEDKMNRPPKPDYRPGRRDTTSVETLSSA